MRIGQALRQYRIESQLGGETSTVYRARDTQLERAVAIRILPEGPRQAKSASALKHPNLITIYDVDAVEVDGQPVDFIAMEYIPGKTLEQLIGRKGLRPNEALGYAVEIADGLAAAHAAGLVHGNLKPANIIVNKQGEVKILDLGLAERTGESSDILSFGVMLRQMLSGDRADDSSSLASLPGVPRELVRVIVRCTEKDPQRRWQSMADIRSELEDVLADLERAQTSGASTRRRGMRLLAGLALVAVALAGGTYLGARWPTSEPNFERLTYQRGDVSGAKFSPDGQTVLFSAQWATDPTRIFSMRPGRNEYSALDLPSGRILSISSSGEMAILLGSGGANGGPGTLARVPLSGGAPREVLDNVSDADWSPDANHLAVSRTAGGRNRIEYPIGTLLDESSGRPPLYLRVSPKGDLLAFFEYDSAVGDFAVTTLDLHGKKRVLSRGWRGEGGLAWSPRGDEIWFSGTKTGGEPVLRAVKMNGQERMVVAAPAWMVLKDVTRGGRVLATAADSRMGIAALAGGAKEERDFSWFEASRIYDISSDGKTLLFVEVSDGKDRNTAIYLRKTDGSPAIRLGEGQRPMLSPDGRQVACIVSDGAQTRLMLLPTGAGEARTVGAPSGMHYERVEWFPDGQRLLFQGNEPNRPARTFIQDLNGGKPVPLTPEGGDATHISPDEKYLTMAAAGKLSLLPVRGGDAKAIANLDPGESVIRWSGDGRYLFLRKLQEPALLNIYRLEVATGRKELWRELRAPDPVGVQISQVVLTPDGNSYAYSFQRDISTLYLVDGLK